MATAAELIERGKAVFSGEYVAKSELESAKLDLQAAQAALTTAENKVAELTEKVTSTFAVNTELADKLAASEARVKELEAERATAGKEAARMIASVGQPPIVIEQTQTIGTTTEENFAAKYRAIKDPTEKGKFWEANKDRIVKDAGLPG